ARHADPPLDSAEGTRPGMRRKLRRLFLLAAAATLVASVSVAACSSDSGGAPASPTPDATPFEASQGVGPASPTPDAGAPPDGSDGSPADAVAVADGPSDQINPAFGTSGVTTVDVFGSADIVTGVVVQNDGKIVVAGEAFQPGDGGTYHTAVMRFDARG